MNGVVVIDKPGGWTSHDVVARVRKLLRIKKVGHGGTLDPLATGVLPVYLGEGTKLVPFNLEGTKEYLAKMKLGQETNTLDADGEIIAETGEVMFTREEIERILSQFRGTIRQIPPLFSAIKIDGVPLYKRARAGETPRVAERETTIHALSLREICHPCVTIEVTCARGTYIRTLCSDIGRSLGCGAHVVELKRLRSGKFTLKQAVGLEDLSRMVELERVQDQIISLLDGVDVAGTIRVDEKTAEMVRQGRPIGFLPFPETERKRLKRGQRLGLWYGAGRLLAIAEAQEDGEGWLGDHPPAMRILRVFHEGRISG